MLWFAPGAPMISWSPETAMPRPKIVNSACSDGSSRAVWVYSPLALREKTNTDPTALTPSGALTNTSRPDTTMVRPKAATVLSSLT